MVSESKRRVMSAERSRGDDPAWAQVACQILCRTADFMTENDSVFKSSPRELYKGIELRVEETDGLLMTSSC